MCLSVVIQVVQQFNVHADKTKTQTLIGLHRDRIEASPVARQPVKAPGRPRQVLRPGGDIQGGQQFSQALCMNRLNAAHAPTCEKRFKAFVPECENRKLLSLGLQAH